MNTRFPECLTDEQLVTDLIVAAAKERDATGYLIALIAEMDARKLYLAQGYSSLFVYCVRCLKLSEHAAYGRIEAARASRRFPVILELLTDGSITLTAVCLLSPHLTEGNYREVLEAAKHKTKREVERQAAGLSPRPAVASIIRKLPAPDSPRNNAASPRDPREALLASASTTADASRVSTQPRNRPPVVTPLAPERYKVQLTISRGTHDKLRRVQDLLRHVLLNGDPAAIFDRALTLLLHELERKKLAG